MNIVPWPLRPPSLSLSAGFSLKDEVETGLLRSITARCKICGEKLMKPRELVQAGRVGHEADVFDYALVCRSDLDHASMRTGRKGTGA
jgi:hypothetical protein